MKSFLNYIDSPAQLRLLRPEDLPQLAKELREFIINIIATKEGHLGASLGVVELTIALHYVRAERSGEPCHSLELQAIYHFYLSHQLLLKAL